jgi:drug/metabolite transporter (DMT)-like permease
MNPSPVSASLWMLASSIAFTAMSAFTHALGGRCPWPVVAFSRAILAFVFASLLVRPAKARFIVLRPRSIWLRSIAGSCSMLLTFYALPRLPLANTAVLTNTSPLWIGLLSWPILGKPPTRGVWAAILVSLFGVAIILRPERDVDVWASAAAAGAAVCSAFAMMGLHRVAALDHRAVVAHFSATAAFFTFLASITVGGGRFPPVPDDVLVWQLLLAVGLTATVGQLCMTRAYARGQPASIAVVGLSQVVFGLIIDVVFWNRHIDGWTLLGIALVVIPTGCLMSATRREFIPPRERRLSSIG